MFAWLGGKLPRDNNFDLIRLFAALQVVTFHSTIHLHAPLPPVIANILELFPGVPIFFFISGFLVTSSLAGRSLASYAEARIRRVFPALWLAFLIAVSILTVFDQIDAQSPQFWIWVATQISVFQVYNPEMFRDFGVGVVNGSLWTIPVEIGFYIFLPISVWLAQSSKERLTAILVIFGSISFAVYLLVRNADNLFLKILNVTPVAHLWLFALGSLAYIHLDRIVRSNLLKYALPTYLVFGIFVAPLAPEWAVKLFGAPLLLCSVLFIGLGISSRAKWLRGNDISYGLYLFHMLIVNVLAEVGIMGIKGVILSFILSCGVAWLSWEYLESRLLRGKVRLPRFIALLAGARYNV